MLTAPAVAAPEPDPASPTSAAPAHPGDTDAPTADRKREPRTLSAADAAPPMSAAAAEAESIDDGLPTSEDEKVRAAREIGIEADNQWLGQTDRNFVFKIWQNSANYPLVRAAAELALSANNDVVEAVCKEFILTGIFEAKLADDAKKISDEAAAREARDLKRAAYAAAGLMIDTEGRMLTLSERDAIIEIWTRATGPRVKAAAQAVLNSTAEAQHEFLATGARTAAEQDVQDAIAAAAHAGAAEQARLARVGAVRAAAALIGVVAGEGLFVMTDDNVVRFIWEQVDTDQNRLEIRDAAVQALRSSDAVVWRAFIDTGMKAANGRDLAREIAEREAADKALAESIRVQANADGNNNLAIAAYQALRGGASVIAHFNRIGRNQVASDNANRPSGKPWQWINANSGKCLAPEGNTVVNGQAVVQTTCSRTETRQRWVAMRVYNTTDRYRITSHFDPSQCVGLATRTAASNIRFTLRACDGGADQYFTHSKQGDNYLWVNEFADRAITVQGASKVDGAATLTADVGDGTSQQWYPTSYQLVAGQELGEAKVIQSYFGHTARLQDDGNFVISKGGKTVWASNTTTGTRLVNQRDGNLVLYSAGGTPVWKSDTYGKGVSTLRIRENGNLQLFRNDTIAVTWSSGFSDYSIVSLLHGKCVTVPNGNYESSVQLVMMPCDGGPAQQFMFKDTTWISLNGKCIHLQSSSGGPPILIVTSIQLYTCNNSGSQKFDFYDDDTFRNTTHNRCIEIPNSNRADGVKVENSTCGTGANQKWKFVLK